jgi:hypothetical protein
MRLGGVTLPGFFYPVFRRARAMRTGSARGAAIWGWITGSDRSPKVDGELSVGESIVLAEIEKADGRGIDAASISDGANTSREKTEHALGRLQERGFVAVGESHPVLGLQFRLSAKGRVYLLSQRVQETPAQSPWPADHA